jgi:3',5'-cyclic AMP phosphodiesterase CpdA
MVIAGDVTTGKKDDYTVLDSVLQSTTFVQTCLVAGNHDLYFDGWKSFHEMFGSSTYTMQVNTADSSDLFIFLDSGSGTLGTLQLDWLKNLLQTERANYRHVIITTHLNFFRNRMTGSTNPLNEELLVLLDLFERHKVDLLVSGHDHDRYLEVFGHTQYLTLDAMVDEAKQASYMKLTVNGDGLDYQFIKF